MKHRTEMAWFAAALAVCNLPIFLGWPSNPFVLDLAALADGQWWRWCTFVWAHVSLYHLAVDAAAFGLTYTQLDGSGRARGRHLALCALASGLIPMWLDPRVATIGLGGLSGLAHGLMLVTTLEGAAKTNPFERCVSFGLFLALLGKTILEQSTGQAVFANLHLGNVGTPIASCHLGGLVGGLVSYLIGALPSGRPSPALWAKREPALLAPRLGASAPNGKSGAGAGELAQFGPFVRTDSFGAKPVSVMKVDHLSKRADQCRHV